MSITSIILAAGRGTRMASSLPKVLHAIAGKPMLGHVLDAVAQFGRTHVVVGHGAEQVMEFCQQYCQDDPGRIRFAVQQQQLGTGHAVQAAMPSIEPCDKVLVVLGDVPLIRPQTLARLVNSCSQGLCLLSLDIDNPTGYGRIVRNAKGQVEAIVEHKECTQEQLAIKEINTGIMVFDHHLLQAWLPKLKAQNCKHEYYLTDLIALAVADGVEVNAIKADCAFEVMGVNDQLQLATLERHHRRHRGQAGASLGRVAAK